MQSGGRDRAHASAPDGVPRFPLPSAEKEFSSHAFLLLFITYQSTHSTAKNVRRGRAFRKGLAAEGGGYGTASGSNGVRGPAGSCSQGSWSPAAPGMGPLDPGRSKFEFSGPENHFLEKL